MSLVERSEGVCCLMFAEIEGALLPNSRNPRCSRKPLKIRSDCCTKTSLCLPATPFTKRLLEGQNTLRHYAESLGEALGGPKVLRKE